MPIMYIHHNISLFCVYDEIVPKDQICATRWAICCIQDSSFISGTMQVWAFLKFTF